MNKKYNKLYSLINAILIVFIGLSVYFEEVIPNSYYILVFNIGAFLASIILTSLVFIHEKEFNVFTKVVTLIISGLIFITTVINIFILLWSINFLCIF